MFYAAPEKHGTITVKPKIIKNRTNTIKPANDAKPASLAQFQKEIEARQNEIASLNRRQYTDMLKGVQTGELDAAVARQEAALKALKTRYSNAMGLGERKRGNQLLPQSNRKAEENFNTLQQPDRTAGDDKAFWDGFKRGMGLKAGEELGQESVMSGRPEGLSFAAQDTPAHGMGLNGRVQPLTNPGTAVDKEGIIDRDDYDDLGDYWDAVEDALDGYLAYGDAQGAAGLIINNDINDIISQLSQ